MNLKRPQRPRGFTLIEMMIVIAIAALMLAIGVPTMFRSLRKEGMRKAVSDVMEACSTARAAAILSGRMTEMVIHPADGTFSVSSAGVSEEAQLKGQKIEAPPTFSSSLPDGIGIELLGVNFVELQEADEARVKFYPNGTCDEFSVVLSALTGEKRLITLEVITGFSDWEVIK